MMFNFKKKKQKEIVIDDTFGKIVYCDFQWVGTAEISLFNSSFSVDVELYNDGKKNITDEQKSSFQKYKNNLKSIEENIENILKSEFGDINMNNVPFKPVSLVFKKNGDFALIVSVGETDDIMSQNNIAICISPELKYDGSDESYMSEVFFTQ